MNLVIRAAIERAGFYYAKRRYMPSGVDWLWDIQRLTTGRNLHTVFDVGANVGQTTRAIKARFPHANVHAFEPVSSTYETLRRNVRDLEGVTAHRLALADRAGSMMMTADAGSPLNHLIPDPSATSLPMTERVDAETLDRFCAERRIDRIDLLKVDVEGADLLVFQGAGGLLREGRVAFVLAEVGFDPCDAGHVHLSVLLDHLARAGAEPYAFYDYCRLEPPDYTRERLGLVFANLLCLWPDAVAQLR